MLVLLWGGLCNLLRTGLALLRLAGHGSRPNVHCFRFAMLADGSSRLDTPFRASAFSAAVLITDPGGLQAEAGPGFTC